MQTDRISYLLDRFLKDELSPAELRELYQLLEVRDGRDGVRAAMPEMIDKLDALADDAGYREEAYEPLLERVLARGEQMEVRRGRVVKIWKRAAAVAAVLLVMGGGVWMLTRSKQGEPVAVRKNAPGLKGHDILPGSNKAVLTLADNTTIDLDGAKNGSLGKQGGTEVLKHQDGQLSYKSAGGGATVAYNLLTTPRGGQYQLILPDSSKVWLNAASSLRYPTAFTGKERVVELKGEAYFEIAANASMPFKVMTRGADAAPVEVDVLGTHFNVKAYPEEVVNTTLLEGSVKVASQGLSAMVKPGEGARFSGGRIAVMEADVEEAVARKNGLFKFNEATIEEVMRQLSRWYDVEVVYESAAPKDLFRGEMYRNVNVSKVLKVLEASGLRFSVEGKRIIVK